MVKWQVVFTKQAQKDAMKVSSAGLRPKVESLIGILEDDPFKNPPPYEKLVGDLTGLFTRRINIYHRLVYQVFEKEKVVKIIRMWTQ